jgi:hypothetical protein
MEDLSSRTAQEVLDDHLNLAENWGGKVGFERGLQEDLRRNLSKDIVILINRGTFPGHDGVWREGWLSWSGPTRTTRSG